MQTALVALMANGFRPDTNRLCHHMTVIQSLPTTVGLPSERMAVLDVFRRKRNLADYTGDEIDDVSAENCISAAVELLQIVIDWLTVNQPDLIG